MFSSKLCWNWIKSSIWKRHDRNPVCPNCKFRKWHDCVTVSMQYSILLVTIYDLFIDLWKVEESTSPHTAVLFDLTLPCLYAEEFIQSVCVPYGKTLQFPACMSVSIACILHGYKNHELPLWRRLLTRQTDSTEPANG